jgi:hypothetical protein
MFFLIGHEGTHTLPFSCPMCNASFSTKYEMECHFGFHHAKKKLFQCQFCDKPLLNLSGKIRHERNCSRAVPGIVQPAESRSIFQDEYIFDDPLIPLEPIENTVIV